MKARRCYQLVAVLLAVFMVFTLTPLPGMQKVNAESTTASGGEVTVDTDVSAKESAMQAFDLSDSDVTINGDTITIKLQNNRTLNQPVKFIKGTTGKKVVLDLNGFTITGKAGELSDDPDKALGGNTIEIAADEFDVEIKGPGSVIGGKGGVHERSDYDGCRVGRTGGSAVYFSERVDKLHGTTGTFEDIIDEGYHPSKLEYGLTVTGGAALIGGAGADVTYSDWEYNAGIGDEDYFSVTAGKGGNAIGQVFSGTDAAYVLEELSYAKIAIDDGSVTGGAGGNADIGDHFLTTTDIQKIGAIQEFMEGKSADYDFDSHVTNKIAFVPADGGNGIEFHAGRKYVEVGSDGIVSGGSGGETICSESASKVKWISTKCGDGGIGIYACGDTGMTNIKPSISESSADENYWGNKNSDSDDVGIYVAGIVQGGNSPATTLFNDQSGNGGFGIDSDLDAWKLCKPYYAEYGHSPTFDSDRGIVLVDAGGKVFGGSSGALDERTISGGFGADAITGGSIGGHNASAEMSAAHFIINGTAAGGYGTLQGGDGFHMAKEKEDTSSGNSTYFAGYLYGDGTLKGGDSGEWPYLPGGQIYTANANGVIFDHSGEEVKKVCGNGIHIQYGIHEESVTIGSEINTEDGAPAKVMEEDNSFSVTASMTPFSGAPDGNTMLRCTVNKPNGYNGKAYITWTVEGTNPEYFARLEGANGAFNNFKLLGNKDYPYGWKKESYGLDYKIDVGTYDYMAERLQYGSKFYITCKAMLEDGRYAEYKKIWFSKDARSKEGWEGGSGDGQQNMDAQQRTEARNVANMIANLYSTDAREIKLHDADAVQAARDAYNALVDAGNPYVEIYVDNLLFDKLVNAEARIADLTAADDVTQQIAAIVDLLKNTKSEDGISDEEIATAKETAGYAISNARDAYDALTEEQKLLIPNTETLTAAEELIAKTGEEYQAALATFMTEYDLIAITEENVAAPDVTYNGKQQAPVIVTVKNDAQEDVELMEDMDFKVSYQNNINVGQADYTVIGKGKYTGEIKGHFKIKPKAVTPTVKLSATSYTYNGNVKKPKVTVTSGALSFVSGTDYSVAIKNSKGTVVSSPKAVGTYKVTVKMKGNYSGTKTVSYKINKAANTFKIKAKTATVKYSKLKKKAQTLGVTKVITFKNKGQGSRIFIKKKGNKKITINKTTGKVTIKKKLKKGTYKVTVKVKAKGNSNYKASAYKTITFKVKVK